MGKWVVLGAAALDTIVTVPHLPKPDEIVYPESLDRLPGGSTANVAVGLARLEESVAFLGKTGNDDAGTVIRRSFEEDGVDVSGLITVPGESSGGAFIAVNPEGERVIFSLGGKALYESPAELTDDAFDEIDGLYIGEAFKEVGEEAARRAHERDALVFFGPGGIMCGYGLDYLGGIVALSDYLLVNLPEALALSGRDDKESAIEWLLEAGAKAVILTEGKQGAGCYRRTETGPERFFCPAKDVRAVDTTGAGDTFTAGFLYAVLSHRQWSTVQKLSFASACAAEAVQSVGARSSMPALTRMRDVMIREKAYAALCAFALGDAMGMPTELISREEIRQYYGRVETLIAPDPRHYHADDLSRGNITDDTEVTLEIMDAMIRGGGVSVDAAVDALLTWSQKCDVKNKSYLGPSSRRALEAIEAGADPVEAGKNGTTDGAPMRILPVGILNAGNPQKAAADACTICIPTHGSNVAMAGAGAIAAAAAEALSSDATIESVMNAARSGAVFAESKGFRVRDCELIAVLDELTALSDRMPDDDIFLNAVFNRIAFSMETDLIVPAALTLFRRCHGDPMRAVIAAANLGGDTDTVGAMAGGICGAFSGISSLDPELIREIEAINKIDLKAQIASFFDHLIS